MSVCIDYQGLSIKEGSIVSIKVQFIVAILLIIAISLKIWIKTESTQVGYLLASARQTGIQLDLKRSELELQRSVYLRPDHLKKQAGARLGLRDLSPQQAKRVVYVH